MDLLGITLNPDNIVPQLVFLGLASLAILGSIMMVTRNNAVHSALWLVLVFFQIAGIYVLLNAPFLAALQVLVYTGAILVLFLFVIMLLQMREGPSLGDQHQVQKLISWPVGLLLALEMIAIIVMSRTLSPPPIAAGSTYFNPGAIAPNGVPWTFDNVAAWGGEPRALGIDLYSDFLLPFEVASLILLVAVIGAIMLAGRIEQGALRDLPSIGITLGRRSLYGTVQDEQFGREVRPEITTTPNDGAEDAAEAKEPVGGGVGRS